MFLTEEGRAAWEKKLEIRADILEISKLLRKILGKYLILGKL